MNKHQVTHPDGTKSTRKVSQERKSFLLDVFVTALEGGIGYWSEASSYRWSDADGNEDLDGFHADITDTEQGGDYHVNSRIIARGIRTVLDEDFRVNDGIRRDVYLANSELDAGEIDATAADVIVQAGLFGEIIYG